MDTGFKLNSYTGLKIPCTLFDFGVRFFGLLNPVSGSPDPKPVARAKHRDLNRFCWPFLDIGIEVVALRLRSLVEKRISVTNEKENPVP